MKKLGRLLVALTALLVGLSFLGATASPAAADEIDTVAAENDFIAQINALRASQGLGTLSVDPALTAIARDWSAQMAAAGSISHRPNLAEVGPSNWIRLGENVGVGPSIETLHAAFVASPGHYRNLVDPAFQTIGVGIVMVGDTMYVTENFMTTAASVKAASVTPSSCKTKKCRAAAAAAKKKAPAKKKAAPKRKRPAARRR